MKEKNKLFAVCLLPILLTGCSAVFSSAITGTVEEVDDTDTATTISDVQVYAYLDESDRDSAVTAGTVPDAGIDVFYGVTDDNGEYTIPIEWETTSGAFGKTADRIPIYLAFYHENFGDGKLTAASTVSWLTSDTNSTMNTETLTRTSDTYTLNLDIRDVAQTSDYTVSATNFTITVKNDDGTTTYYSGTPSEDSISFSAPVSDDGISGYITLKPNDSDAYVQCNSDGTYSDDGTYSTDFSLADKNATNSADAAYVKSLVVASVDITGYVQDSSGAGLNGYTVKLYDSSDTEYATSLASATSATLSITDSVTQDGYFSLATPEIQLTKDTYGTSAIYETTCILRATSNDGTFVFTKTVSVSNNTSRSGDYTDIIINDTTE